MDYSLRDYLQLADNSHTYIDKFCATMSVDQLEAKMLELQAAVKTLQSVAKRIADVSNVTARLLHRKKAKKAIKHIDPYPTEYDHGTVRTLNPEKSVELIPGLILPIKEVEEVSEIPVSSLYYVNKLKQFAINVNGIILKGNLGNLVEYQTENSARCEYGVECKSFAKDIACPYYHDPEDFVKHGKDVPAIVRNFTIGSWLYSKNKNPRTYFTRHIGSKNRLAYDLSTLKKVQYREEISSREGQLIHDLLLYLALNSRGLLEKYPHWNVPKI
jgi:hypothetical protein